MSTGRLRWRRATEGSKRVIGRVWRSRVARVIGIVIVASGLFVATQRSWIVEQIVSYATDSRSPPIPADWLVEESVLRQAAEASRGTHTATGEIRHTVDYPHQLLEALQSPTFSVEANVTVIDGRPVLQHDPRVPVGMPLLEFLEYAAIAEFPIVKLDLKRDDIGPIIADVQQAIGRFGLRPSQLHFNANVFRGPGVENDLFGARSDKSFTDRMYNLIVMELETSDLIELAEHFPDATIVISSTTASGPIDEAYSEKHVEQFVRAAEQIRQASPGQSLVFAVRGDVAAKSPPESTNGSPRLTTATWPLGGPGTFPPPPKRSRRSARMASISSTSARREDSEAPIQPLAHAGATPFRTGWTPGRWLLEAGGGIGLFLLGSRPCAGPRQARSRFPRRRQSASA